MKKLGLRSQYHHGDVLAALVQAALEQVESVPPDRISLHALAKEIGVSQAAPYRYVQSRDAFLALVAAKGFVKLVDSRDRLVEAAPEDGKLRTACLAYVAFALDHPGLYRLMFQSGLLGSEQVRGELEVPARKSFSSLVELVARDGRFADPVASAVFIWSSLHGSIIIRLAGLSPFPSSWDPQGVDIVDELFKHIGRGTKDL